MRSDTPTREATRRDFARTGMTGAPHALQADRLPSNPTAPAQDGGKRCAAWPKAHGVA
jgi:hypothetical protein